MLSMMELTQLRQTAHVDLTRLFQQASMISSQMVLIIGTSALAGWQLDIPLLAGRVTDALTPMSIPSAIAFIIASLSLAGLQWRGTQTVAYWASQILAIGVILLGILGVGETALHWQIDPGFAQTWLQTSAEMPARWIPLNTGLNFVLVGNALLLSNRSERWLHRLAQLFTLIAALVAVNAILTNVHPIAIFPAQPTPPMALLTAITFLILCGGIQALHLDEAVMQVARISEGSSEGMVCQLLLAAIALTVVEACVTLWERPQTSAEIVFNLSFLSIKTVLFFTLLISWSISLLTRIRQDYQKAEAVVDESLSWLNLAQEAAGIGRWEWDIKSNQLRWCVRQENLFGFAPGTFAGTFAAFLDCVHPDDRATVENILTQTVAHHQDYFDEFRIVLPDQKVRWILAKGRCFCNSSGRVIGISGVNLDITERQQFQAQRNQLFRLEQSARANAEAANRMKDEFLSILSHEVRTPLNSVLGWIRLLRTRSLADPTFSQRGFEALERNAQAQAQILGDLLDMARVVQGKLKLHIRPTNLNAVIVAAFDIVRPAAQAKQLQIHTHLEPDLPNYPGDRARLQQIVWNLLSNAVKFTPAKGTITLTLTQTETAVQIIVSDTGKGISPEFLPYVFDRFRQEDSSLTRSYGGLGLGLALVRYLVELHGGTIKVSSAGIGHGATFTVTLPLAATP
jgi:PAS domain S-box-containing protein